MTNSSKARSFEALPEQFNAATDLINPNLEAGHGPKPAVIDYRGTTSYAELSIRVNKMKNVCDVLKIHRGERILLCLLDTVDFPTAFLGAIKGGAVPVPLNTMLAEADFRWILENSGAVAVIVSEELAPIWNPIAHDFPAVRFIYTGTNAQAKTLQLEKMLGEASPEASAADTHRDDVAFWLYTSGSTGRPKGTLHTHASMRLTANLFAQETLGLRESDVVLSIAKQFFAYGLGNALSFPYAAGATAVLNKERPTPENVTALMKKHHVTILCGVPTFFANWFGTRKAPASEDVPYFRLAVSAGESLPAHLCKAFQERFGVDVIDGLGSTEMLHIFLSQKPGLVRPGCTGRPVPGYDLKIVDDNGAICEPGQIGELQVKGPTAAIGYWKNRAKSTATFQGEWVRTGDKYSCDAEGWYHHSGRSDDMLKVNGMYVSPSEVEEVLTGHELVMEAAVIGAADADGLIKPKAYIVLKPGILGSLQIEETLKSYVKGRLTPFKYPRWIVFVKELPKTATGKIQRFELRARG